jgi:heme oxygenase
MKTLKEYTAHIHDEIELIPFSKKFLSGQLTIPEWHMFLLQKLEIYTLIEQRKNLPEYVIAKHKISADCSGLVPLELESTKTYLDHLRTLPEDLLDAHIYVHYLGDLYGGQILKSLAPGIGNRISHLEFDDRIDAITFIRDMIENRGAELAEEAIAGFNYTMDIQNEIFRIANTD